VQIYLTYRNDADPTKIINITITGDPTICRALEKKVRELADQTVGWIEI